MRPIEMLMGRPVGAIEVRFGVDDVGAAYGIVECYNGLTGKSTFLTVDGLKAVAIDDWIKRGKPGNIQDNFPDFTADEREQMISGITPDEWDEMFGGEDE
jgi:hypothetical protein